MKRLAIGLLAAAALAGCAPLDTRPAYVGVFTGEYVDGLPLVRFPAIEVVGYRRDAAPAD
jgi:hypothetical protein